MESLQEDGFTAATLDSLSLYLIHSSSSLMNGFLTWKVSVNLELILKKMISKNSSSKLKENAKRNFKNG